MKLITSRKALIVTTIVTVGLAIALSVRTTCVDAQSCDDLMVDWTLADWEYSGAFQSWFYDSPTSCADDCSAYAPIPTAFAQCVQDCQITRQTRLAAADLALFDAAWDTCTPATLDQCDQARQMADNCAIQYNYLDYPIQEESLAIYQQYSACILASKINSCV